MQLMRCTCARWAAVSLLSPSFSAGTGDDGATKSLACYQLLVLVDSTPCADIRVEFPHMLISDS